MKTLYAWSDEVEKKSEVLDQMDTRDDVIRVVGLDPYEATLSQCLAHMMQYILGVPAEIFEKKLVDLTEDDIALLEAIETELVTFTRA